MKQEGMQGRISNHGPLAVRRCGCGCGAIHIVLGAVSIKLADDTAAYLEAQIHQTLAERKAPEPAEIDLRFAATGRH